MTPEEVLAFLNDKTAAADTVWSQIGALEVNLDNKPVIESKISQLNTVIDEAKVVYDANLNIAYKHGFCVARNKYYFRINKLQKQLNALA